MCIHEFAYCEDCGFTRHYASIHCNIYLAKLYKHIGFGDGLHPDTETEPCPHVIRTAEVRIGPLACPNMECPKVLRAPELRRQMEADRLAKLLKKQRHQDAVEAYQRRFAKKYFIRRVPILPPRNGYLNELVKEHQEKEAEAAMSEDTPETKAMIEAKAKALQSYMIQCKTGSYANVFEDSVDDCDSLTPDSGSKRSGQTYAPKTPSQSNELGRSLPIPIKDPGRRCWRGKGGSPPEGTDAHISCVMESVLSMADRDWALKYKTLSGWRSPKPRSK